MSEVVLGTGGAWELRDGTWATTELQLW
jgi:hypothetical protein